LLFYNYIHVCDLLQIELPNQIEQFPLPTPFPIHRRRAPISEGQDGCTGSSVAEQREVCGDSGISQQPPQYSRQIQQEPSPVIHGRCVASNRDWRVDGKQRENTKSSNCYRGYLDGGDLFGRKLIDSSVSDWEKEYFDLVQIE